jgi:ferredoxin
MSFLITEVCIRCKYQDCVQVCPVDCFHEGVNMLVIDPEECIDCGLCVPECNAEAIIEGVDDEGTRWLDLNTEYAQKWPIISDKGEVPADGEEFERVANKLEKYFDPSPANR